MRPRRAPPANASHMSVDSQHRSPLVTFARRVRAWFCRAAVTARHQAYSLLCRFPIGMRLTGGFLFAGLVAVLASSFAGLLPSQARSQIDLFQMQLNTASTELTTALVLLQAEQNKVHLLIEDAVEGQPSSLLLSDEDAVRSLADQFEAQIGTFEHTSLLSQQAAQEQMLHKLGLGEAIEQQHGLMISVIYAWRQYRAAQVQALQDIVAGQVNAATALVHAQADPMGIDTLSALYSLMQFESHLVASVQRIAGTQEAHHQQVRALLIAAVALMLILIIGLVVTISFIGPLQQLRRATQTAFSEEGETRLAVIGQDEIADISAWGNDLLAAMNSMMAEINRQHQGILSTAEYLLAEVGREDQNTARARLAEVGDPLKVLDAVCRDVIARFHEAERLGLRTTQAKTLSGWREGNVTRAERLPGPKPVKSEGYEP